MIEIKAYQVWAGFEDEDGQSVWYPSEMYTTYEDAKKASIGRYRGWLGRGDGQVKETYIKIFENCKEHEQLKKEELEKISLTKITSQEKESLEL